MRGLPRSARWVRLVAPGLLAALAACGGEPIGEGRAPDQWRLERQDLIVEVQGSGKLSAVRTTPMTVPDVPVRGLILARMLEPGAVVEEGDIVAEFDPSESVLQYRDKKADHRKATLAMDKNRSTAGHQERIVEAEARQADVDLERARVDVSARDERIASRNDRIEAELGEELAAIRRGLQREKASLQSALGTADQDILGIAEEKAHQEMELAEQALDAMTLRAPHAGMVLYETQWGGRVQVGDTFWPGRSIGEIPDLSSFEVECTVPEADAAPVEKGQEAVVRLDALPEMELRGVVEKVATVATTKERDSPVKYVEVTVALPEQNASLLRLGMRAEVRIHAGRLEQALVVPRLAVRELGGRPFVYVRTEEGPVRRNVALGRGDGVLVAVEEGLEEGETVLLAGPAAGGEDAEEEEEG